MSKQLSIQVELNHVRDSICVQRLEILKVVDLIIVLTFY